MNKIEEAHELFRQGFNCGQAVLSVFRDEISIDKETALKIATGFGGGARNGELCGAVTGAIMVLGLMHGHSDKDDLESKSSAYAMTKDFTDNFRSVHGHIVCKILLGYDVSIPEEHKILENQGAFDTQCPKFIESAIAILEEMLRR